MPAGVANKNRYFYRSPTRHLRHHHPINGEPATHGNGSTIGFLAQSPEQADACHAAGVANGGVTCEDPRLARAKAPAASCTWPTCATPMATSCACCTALRLEPTPRLLYFFKSFQRSTHGRWKLFHSKPFFEEDPCMQSASANLFDEAYYQRFYFDKKTSVVDPEHMERLGMFVCSYQTPARAGAARAGRGLRHWPVEGHRRAALSRRQLPGRGVQPPTCASALAGSRVRWSITPPASRSTG